MHPLFSYDLTIFDCDGVILDSNLIKVDAMERALLDMDFDRLQVSECKQYFLRNFGKSRFQHIRYFVEFILKVPVGEQEKTYSRILDAYSSQCSLLYRTANVVPGINEVLSYMRSKKAVASGSEQNELRAVLKNKGFCDDFELIYGSPKSKSDNVNKILRKISHNRAVLIGDSVADFEAAQLNSIDFFGFLPFSTVSTEMKKLAKQYHFQLIHSWSDLYSGIQV